MRRAPLIVMLLVATSIATAVPGLASSNEAFVDGCAKYEVDEQAWELAPGAPPLDITLVFTEFRDGEPTAFTASTSNYEFVSLKAGRYVGGVEDYEQRHAISHLVFCPAEIGG